MSSSCKAWVGVWAEDNDELPKNRQGYTGFITNDYVCDKNNLSMYVWIEVDWIRLINNIN